MSEHDFQTEVLDAHISHATLKEQLKDDEK
jgi:hypothetical protein